MAKQKLDPAQVQRDLERFAAAVKESEKADKAKREKERAAKADSDRQVAAGHAQQRALTDAQRALAHAVEAVRQAKQHGKGRAEADAAWKAAKARVIELETGTAPAWAPRVDPTADEAPSDDAADAGDVAADVADAGEGDAHATGADDTAANVTADGDTAAGDTTTS